MNPAPAWPQPRVPKFNSGMLNSGNLNNSLGHTPNNGSQPKATEPLGLTDTIPPKRTAWDILAKTSLTGMVIANGGLLFSPQIAKVLGNKNIQTQLKTRLGDKVGNKVEQWAQKNANYQTLKETLNRTSSFATLFQLNTGYQVGINTQQPSKSLASLAGTGVQALVCKDPKTPYLQTLSYLTSFFWFAGETNDIKNTVNPGQRREFDQHRLFRALKGEQQPGEKGFFNELKNTLKFMGKDFGYAMSIGPWKNLQEAIKNKDDFKKPQPYQTAIGAQLNLIAFIASTTAFIAQLIMKKMAKKNNPKLNLQLRDFANWPAEFKKIPERFTRLSQCLMALSIISYMPVLMRALQSKGEVDGALTFLGVPLITAGQVLKGTLDLKHWQGLTAMGSPIVNEGKRINSKKYRAQVNYLTTLQQEACRNPNLQATDILRRLEANPNQLNAMAETMGQFRVDYILNLLRAGAAAQQTEHITLANYLQPRLTLGA